MKREKEIVEEIIAWIDSNIHARIKVCDVASRAGYSQWHFQRIFKKVSDKSLGLYIREKKLELAARDLLQTRESIVEISLKFGFDSQPSFTRSFIRKYRVGPGHFRKALLTLPPPSKRK